jgi:hypothetical protein
LTNKIIGAAFEVAGCLGHGFLEAVNQKSLTPMSQMTADSAGGMAIFTAKTPRKDQDTKELRGF